MSLLPMYRDKEHKFKDVQWTWSKHEAKLTFHSKTNDKRFSARSSSVEAGLEFRRNIDVAEEKIFREKFLRPDSFYDSKVVTLQDIKNVALFTVKSKLPTKLINLLHQEMYDKFLRGVIFYTDLFLMVLELLLIRRDEELEGTIRDAFSIEVERCLSEALSDRRLLISREYSKVLLAESKKDLSAQKDLHFFESLIDFTTQCTFIAMHRRAFNAISCEVNRLFRTEFFNVRRNKSCFIKFNCREQQILYGKSWSKNSLKNFRHQMSPVISELLIPSERSDEILKIGDEKYFGSNKYLCTLELGFSIPEVHLHLAGQNQGILGHPKYIFDTMLNLNEQELQKMNWSNDYDPYSIIKRTSIKILSSDDFVKRRINRSTRLIVQREAYGGIENQLKLWRRKKSPSVRD